MQDDAVEIKSNMMASGKLKTKVEMGNRENKRFREHAGSSGSDRSTYDKMDDMARTIKELSNKISRMELDQSKSDPFIKREFIRNPNPQNQQRQVKNEDQKIQTPLKNENFIGGNDLQDFEDLDEDVTNLGDDYTRPYLMKEDYENSLNTQQPSNKDEDINNTDFAICQETTDSIMAEVQPRYNLRSKRKPALTLQPKKILPRGEVYEPSPKEADTPNRKIRGSDLLDPKIEEVENQTKETNTAKTHIPLDKLTGDKLAQTNK
jgi:hypothetical protein